VGREIRGDGGGVTGEGLNAYHDVPVLSRRRGWFTEGCSGGLEGWVMGGGGEGADDCTGRSEWTEDNDNDDDDVLYIILLYYGSTFLSRERETPPELPMSRKSSVCHPSSHLVENIK
jgi:hypothetical protein